MDKVCLCLGSQHNMLWLQGIEAERLLEQGADSLDARSEQSKIQMLTTSSSLQLTAFLRVDPTSHDNWDVVRSFADAGVAGRGTDFLCLPVHPRHSMSCHSGGSLTKGGQSPVAAGLDKVQPSWSHKVTQSVFKEPVATSTVKLHLEDNQEEHSQDLEEHHGSQLPEDLLLCHKHLPRQWNLQGETESQLTLLVLHFKEQCHTHTHTATTSPSIHALVSRWFSS